MNYECLMKYKNNVIEKSLSIVQQFSTLHNDHNPLKNTY